MFNVATHKQIARGLKEPGYWINKSILRRDVDLPPLVDIDELRDLHREEAKAGDV